MTEDAPIALTLSADERRLLLSGLLQWNGPTSPTAAFARAVGFDTVADLLLGANHLFERVEASAPLTPREWTQVQLLVEVAWASDVFGAAFEWEAIGPFDDARTLAVLRRLQHELGRVTAPRLLDEPER